MVGFSDAAVPLAGREVTLFIGDRLAARIAGFPPHAVAAAKASVVRAESDVTPHLIAEGRAFNGTLSVPAARATMERFLELGGQTPEGERRLGALAGEMGG